MKDVDDAVPYGTHEEYDDNEEDDAIPAQPLPDLENFDNWFAIADEGEEVMLLNDAIEGGVSLSDLHSDFFMVPAAGFANAQCSKMRYAEDENVDKLFDSKNDLLHVEVSLEQALTHPQYQAAEKHLQAIKDIVADALRKYEIKEGN